MTEKTENLGVTESKIPAIELKRGDETFRVYELTSTEEILEAKALDDLAFGIDQEGATEQKGIKTSELRQIAEKGRILGIYDEVGKLIGQCQIILDSVDFLGDDHKINSNEAFYYGVAVDPDHQSQGIGDILTKAALEIAKQTGKRIVHSETFTEVRETSRVTVRAENGLSVRILTNNGFHIVGYDEEYYDDMGENGARLILEKDLINETSNDLAPAIREKYRKEGSVFIELATETTVEDLVKDGRGFAIPVTNGDKLDPKSQAIVLKVESSLGKYGYRGVAIIRPEDIGDSGDSNLLVFLPAQEIFELNEMTLKTESTKPNIEVVDRFEVDESEVTIRHEEHEQMQYLSKRRFIKDKYKLMIPAGSKEMSKEMKLQLEAELKELEKERTVNGVDYSYCQFWKIAAEYNNKDTDGQPKKVISIESFSPYLKDYLDYLSTANSDNHELRSKLVLRKEDEIGIRILLKLLDKMPEAHIVSLFDEYNLWASASNVLGRPLDISEYKSKDDPDMQKRQTAYDANYVRGEAEAPNSLKQAFRILVKQIMIDSKVISEEDTEGAEGKYNLLSESEKVPDAISLVELLNEQGLIEGDISSDNSELYFQNTKEGCEDPRYMRILLRDAQGHWQCPALDASSYLDKENDSRKEKYKNKNVIHLTILADGTREENGRLVDSSFRDERNMVWEILRALKNDQGKSIYNLLHVHDIFFDPDKEIEEIEAGLDAELDKYEIH